VRVVVDVPRRLTKEQKKLIEQLGATMAETPIVATPPGAVDKDRPFFDKVKDLFG
jgi:hypothetical protein